MAARNSPLYPIHESQRAVFGTYGDWHFAMRFGEVAHEYRAARTRVAVVDWNIHVLARLTGSDRQAFLNRLVSNKVELGPGDGVHAFLLSSTGKPLIEMWIYERGEDTLIEVPHSLHKRIKDDLERYHFREDLQIHDASNDFAGLAILGPQARPALESLHGAPLPDMPLYSCTQVDLDAVPALCCRTGRMGVDGFVLWVPRSRAAAAWETLLGADPAPEALGMEALEILRVEAGIPAHGIDYTEETLFLEMAPMDSYSEEKGCYIGQEVVARILHQGHVNRRLVGLEIQGEEDDPAEPGAQLTAGEAAAGRITSTVVSPALGPIALGYVRREHFAAGTELGLPDGRRARVVELPFTVPEEALREI